MTELSFAQKLAYNIGLIVLQSQELERHLKFLTAATDSSSAASLLVRHKKLQHRPLGQVVERFLENATVTEGSIETLEQYFAQLLDRRNKVVHHFYEAYAPELAREDQKAILGNLAQLHHDLRDATRSFRSLNESFAKSLQSEESLAS